MKLIFNNFEDNTEAELLKSVKRAHALVDNLKDLENYEGQKPYTKGNVKEITFYCDDYADECYVTIDTDKVNVTDVSKHVHVEILTKDEAESNEREYMSQDRFTAEDRANYKLGVTLQHYLPLGDSGYWYTLK